MTLKNNIFSEPKSDDGNADVALEEGEEDGEAAQVGQQNPDKNA